MSIPKELQMAAPTANPVAAAKAKKAAGLEVGNDAAHEVYAQAAAIGEKDASKVDLVGVVFKKHWRRWYKGDKAGFRKSVADNLVKAGVANYGQSFLKRVAAKVAKGAKPAKKAAAKGNPKAKGEGKGAAAKPDAEPEK